MESISSVFTVSHRIKNKGVDIRSVPMATAQAISIASKQKQLVPKEYDIVYLNAKGWW